MKVAFQGEPGAYSEAAAAEMLGEGLDLVPCRRLEDVFVTVESGGDVCGVVPIENSLGGSITGTYDLLLRHDLQISAEHVQRISHSLLAMPGTDIAALRRVYSHPQALAQCERLLSAHPEWEVHATYDTAGSAKMVAEQRLEGAAAIASERAGTIYGLQTLAREIEDDESNFTRFIRIGREVAPPSGRDRTSLVFGTRDIPGALFKCLSIFAIRDINLKKLESRPDRGRPWHYLFYVDFDGHPRDEPCARAIEHLREICVLVKVLGSCPRAQ